MEFVTEPAKQVRVYADTDVLVVGGGIAGCTAAIAAANAGAKVILLERNGCLGGVLVSNIIPNLLNNHFDREGRMQLCGVPETIMRRLYEAGGCSKDYDKPMAKLVFDEQKLKIVLIDLLEEAGVEVLTHVYAAAPIMEDNVVKGAFFETKVGRMAVFAKVVVDCSGEADMLAQTGCPMRTTEGTSTLAFKMSGVDGNRFNEYFKAHPEEFPKNHDGIRDYEDFRLNWEEYGMFYFPHRGGRELPFVQKDISSGRFSKARGNVFGLDMMCLIGLKETGDISVNSMLFRLRSLGPKQVSEAETEMQKTVYYIADYLKEALPGFENAHVSQISQDLGIRVSRAIEGENTLLIEQVTSEEDVHFNDVIGVRSGKPWADDLVRDHPFDHDNEGQVDEQSVKGETAGNGTHFFLNSEIDISYGILLPKNVENILAGSGKIVSSIPQTTMRCGTNSMRPAQGAGAAAAVAALTGKTTHTVDIKEVQRELLKQGVYLGRKERLAELGLA